jgi:CBS domain-containing protein
MSLKPLMTKEITSLPSTATVLDAAKYMTDMNVGSVIVVDNDKPSGILTDRDIVTKVLSRDKDPKTINIRDIMTSPAVTISEDRDIIDVTRLMSERGIRRFPVVDANGKIIGVITLDDVLVFLGQEMQNVATALKTELGK